MARIFTKLNRGSVVAGSAGRVFKKLSTKQDSTPLEQLPPPYISNLDGSDLYWGDYSGYATSFDILVDGVVKATTTDQSFDLVTLNLGIGTHSITVVSKADGYANSDPSEAVSYQILHSGGGSYD